MDRVSSGGRSPGCPQDIGNFVTGAPDPRPRAGLTRRGHWRRTPVAMATTPPDRARCLLLLATRRRAEFVGGVRRPDRNALTPRMRLPVPAVVAALGVVLVSVSCHIVSRTAQSASDLGTQAHLDLVSTSRFCGTCHPADYAEHQQNTHGRAFFDEEARLATRGFRREDCIRCHTPRPVFETGIGMTPMQRWTNLEEGNTCMSCHGRENYDYSRFVGGKECKGAFEPEVASVAHCASCHRIAGTPDQWSRAEHGKQAGRVCIDCHMPLVTRPVAIGEPPRQVRSHVFPASSNEAQLRKAYGYE